MKRHAFDMTSFLFGLVLGAAAVGFILADELSWDIDGRWVLPTALILLGVVGIAGAFSGMRPNRQSSEGAGEEDENLAEGNEMDGVEGESTGDLKTL